MHCEPILRVRGLTKRFPIRQRRRDALRRLLGMTQGEATVKTVLDGVSFELFPGEAMALIGSNGSGKSTLLKLITGSLLPDEGVIEYEGRISAILELGAGFDLSATGRQNMEMQAALWGVEADELRRQAEHIIAFSELAGAIDEPVRTYSSGMLLRLAFSVAIHAQAELLIVDEALAVGDARFQQKCLAAIKAHLARGGALLFVSHDLNTVKTLCSRALLLEGGRIVQQGASPLVCDTYLSRLLGVSHPVDHGSVAAHGKRAVATLTSLRLNGHAARQIAVHSGDWLEVKLVLRANAAAENLAAGFMLHDVRGQDLFGVNTKLAGKVIRFAQAGEVVTVTLHAQVLLGAGQYTLTVAVHDADDYTRNVVFWEFSAVTIEVLDPAGDSVGHCKLPHRLHVESALASSMVGHD